MADKEKSTKKSSSTKSKESSKDDTEAQTPDEGQTAQAEDLVQSDEERKETLDSAPGGNTATGKAKARLSENPPEIPSGEDRGSRTPVQGEPKATFADGPKAKREGLQTEKANYTSSGTIRPNMVGSPSGPVPVQSVANNPEARARLLRDQKQRAQRRSEDRIEALSDDQLDSLSAAEIRAVASDRGYDLSMRGGRRATAREFKRHQEQDERISKSD